MRASSRWKKLVDARLREMERLRPGAGAVGPEYWNSRALRFASAVAGSAESDPLLARVRRVTGRRSSVLDVGAGTGRFALALAPRVAQVVAVDSSAAMLRLLTKEARRLGLANVRTVTARWQEAHVAPADVAICSYVLPLVADAAGFLRKLDGACRRRAFLYLNGASLDLLFDPLWRYFHERPRRPGPTYLDAVAVLSELGISADVEIVEVRTRTLYPTLDAAVRSYRDQLLLPDGARAGRELRQILSYWLVKDGVGLRPPLRTTPVAIVSWAAGGATFRGREHLRQEWIARPATG